MASQTWPSAVPLPGPDYSFVFNDLSYRGKGARSLNPSGIKSGLPSILVSIQQVFNETEFAAFTVWFEDTLLNGALPFNISLELGGGLQTEEVRFQGVTFSDSVDKAVNHAFAANLICYNPTILSEADYDTLAAAE